MTLRELREQEFRQRDRLVQQGQKRLFAAATDIIVRVLAVGQEEEFRRLVVGEDAERVFQRPPRRATAGIVAVETENDRIGKTEELLRVSRCRGRA